MVHEVYGSLAAFTLLLRSLQLTSAVKKTSSMDEGVATGDIA